MESLKIKQVFEEHALSLPPCSEESLRIHLKARNPLYKKLLHYIKPHMTILEAGCSTAIDSGFLNIHTGCSAVACDISGAQLERAKTYSEIMQSSVLFCAQNICSMGFHNNSFDVVFSQGVLEHFKNPSKIASEQLRILKPGGLLIIDVPQKYSLYTLQKHHMMQQGTWPYGYETEFSYTQMKNLVSDAQLIEIFGYSYDWPLSALRKFPQKTGKKLKAGKHLKTVCSAWEEIFSCIDHFAAPRIGINIAGVFKKK